MTILRNTRPCPLGLPPVKGQNAVMMSPGEDLEVSSEVFKALRKVPGFVKWMELGWVEKLDMPRAPIVAPEAVKAAAPAEPAPTPEKVKPVELMEGFGAESPLPMDNSEPPPPPSVVLGELTASEAKGLISKEEDSSVLEGWLSAEERKTLRRAIQRRLKELG